MDFDKSNESFKNENKFLSKKLRRPKEKKSDKKNKPKKHKEETKTIEKTIKLESFEKYKEKKLKQWKDKNEPNFDLKEFVNSYDIHNESQILYMNSIFGIKNEFISHYEKYQFILKIEDRKKIETKIVQDSELMNRPIIYYNIIGGSFSSIREILIKILDDIVSIYDVNIDIIDTLKYIFIKNHVYFDNLFDFLIPTKFSDTVEYKFNKLILDVAYFFFPWEGILVNESFTKEDKDLISKRFLLFKNLTYFIETINLIRKEDELIEKLEFLFNLLKIMEEVDSKQRNYILFHKIISTCYQFDLTIAKNNLQKMKNFIFSGLIIDNVNISKFNIEELKEDSTVKLINKKGKEIEVKAKYINWYLEADLLDYFESDNFMVCFTFEKCLNMNNIKIDKDLNLAFTTLFEKMIKSEVVKDAMLKDSEAKKLDYPFDYEDIVQECKNSVYFVPFPVLGLYGYTDKSCFKIFIYSNFCSLSIKNILTEYDNILKTKIHEYKHVSRLYYHLFNENISIRTPKTKLNNNKKDKALIENNIKFMNDKIKIINEADRFRKVICKQINDLDYGDIFELFFVGIKSNKFFLANSLFFLKESSWNLKSKIFLEKYIENIKIEKVLIKKNKNYMFINSIINYFKLDKENGKYFSNEITIKDSNKIIYGNIGSNYYENEVTDKQTISHCNFKKLLEKKKVE